MVVVSAFTGKLCVTIQLTRYKIGGLNTKSHSAHISIKRLGTDCTCVCFSVYFTLAIYIYCKCSSSITEIVCVNNDVSDVCIYVHMAIQSMCAHVRRSHIFTRHTNLNTSFRGPSAINYNFPNSSRKFAWTQKQTAHTHTHSSAHQSTTKYYVCKCVHEMKCCCCFGSHETAYQLMARVCECVLVHNLSGKWSVFLKL